jgi:hypothetical protein
VWVWPKAKEREVGKQNWRREREKIGEKKKVGPVTVINWDPQRIEFGFESGLDSKTGERLNSNLAWDPHKIQVGISILT